MVWENVPGAFSSNSGEDFRVVLEELARVVEEGVTIPRPPKGKWATTGVIIGDGWSLAWRVFDAQYWGVPQRRRRICIVADFNGHTAPQIVFSEGEHHGSTERGNTKPSVGYIGEKPRPEIQSVCEGLSRNIEQSLSQGEEAPTDASRSLGAGDSEGGQRHVGVDLYNTDITGDVAATLGVNCGMSHGRNGVCTFEPGIASREGGHIYEGVSGTIRSHAGDNQMAVAYSEPKPCSWDGGQTSPTLTARNASGCQRMPDKDNFNAIIQPCVVYDARGNGDGTVAPTMTGDHQNRVTDYTGVVVTYSKPKRAQSATDNETWVESDKTNTLNAFDVGDVRTTEVVIEKEPAFFSKMAIGDYKADDRSHCLNARDYKEPTDLVIETSDGDIAGTLDASYYKGCGERQGKERTFVVKSVDCRNCTEDDVNGTLQFGAHRSLNCNNVVRVKYIVRRLTPLECERLQGFPDNHTNIGEFIDTKGKKCKTSDASRYKALGNSIALPSWKFILKRLCANYERDATMASLFDGIGGFPLIWEQINGKRSCLWASEVESFPIAVTKARIGE